MLVTIRQSYTDYLDYFSDLADLQLIKKIFKFKRVFGTELSIGTFCKKRFEANNVKIDLKIKFDLIAV